MRENERRFRTLTEHGSDYIVVVDDNGVLRYGSPSTERVLGYAPGEFTGRSITSFLHPEDVFHAQQALQSAGEHPDRTEAVEIRVRAKGGDWRVLDATVRRLPRESRESGFVVNARDHTERRQ
ncbi:MAG: PAS domain S-box protein [Armatimonadetes bacterium]|nr:PAS domain S-box protein [Armatimonadota bacterium]NCO93553.1 PAS domain S-box protein [Armatimonadota bacterium]NDK14260.1 PAS domain S-box protein [Armatimonadota bacterium]